MRIERLEGAEALPLELCVHKRPHFQNVFGPYFETMLAASPLLGKDECTLVCYKGDQVVGWVQYTLSMYHLTFRNFTVIPLYRGRGIARRLMAELRDIAANHHHDLVKSGEKPDDIHLMYLKSMIYLDADRDAEPFAFGKFLRKMGFQAHAYNRREITNEERTACDVYLALYPNHIDDLKVFKMLVVDDDVCLDNLTCAELVKLSPAQLRVVREGLRVKLGNFERSGRVSYRYDICPICKAMGSSEQDDSACRQCYIYRTCMAPFREHARFKEDYQVSARYFQAMQDFLDSYHGAA